VDQKAPNNFVKDIGEGFLKECVTELCAGAINTGALAVIKIHYIMFMLKELFMSRLQKPNQDLEITNNSICVACDLRCAVYLYYLVGEFKMPLIILYL